MDADGPMEPGREGSQGVRRWRIVALVVGGATVVVAAVVAILLFMKESPTEVRLEQWAQVDLGMSKATVEGILGEPGRSGPFDACEELDYTCGTFAEEEFHQQEDCWFYIVVAAAGEHKGEVCFKGGTVSAIYGSQG